jgi:hypothetical protein
MLPENNRYAKMRYYLENWLARKCERPLVSIRETRTSRFKFLRALGARGQYAVVEMRGEPAVEFSFSSVARWPGPEFDYTEAVLEAILDELYAVELGHVPARIRLTLQEIEWHDVDSSPVAFYHAARGAVREILGRDQYPGNIDYRRLADG